MTKKKVAMALLIQIMPLMVLTTITRITLMLMCGTSKLTTEVRPPLTLILVQDYILCPFSRFCLSCCLCDLLSIFLSINICDKMLLGNIYYYNNKTGESQWEAPEWVEEMDTASGARYEVLICFALPLLLCLVFCMI